MQFRLKSPRLWLSLVLLLSTTPAQATDPPPPAAPTPPRPCQNMLKTMQNLDDGALERDCMSWRHGENDPPDWQHTYQGARQPRLHTNALPRSCVATWVERKLREDPAGCELTESSPEAEELRTLLHRLTGPHGHRAPREHRQAAQYLLCLQQDVKARFLFISKVAEPNPEDACVAALFSFPDKWGQAKDAQQLYVELAPLKGDPPKLFYVPSAFSSESARLALVPLLEHATQAEYRGRDLLAQLVCEPAPTLPELIEVCRREGQPQELVWQLMTGVTGPALLTNKQVESVLRALRTTWQFNPPRARKQIEHLCHEYPQKTELMAQSCRELRAHQELWLPLPVYQRQRLNEAVTAEYSLRQQAFGVGLGLTVILGLLAGALMLSGKQARRRSRPPR